MPLGAARFGLGGGVLDLGKLELIETKNLSGVSSANFTSLQESTYDVHLMTVNNYIASVDAQVLRCRFYESGVEETASVYRYAVPYGSSGAVGFGYDTSAGADFIPVTATTGNAAREVGNSVNYFYNLGNSGRYSTSTFITSNIRSDGSFIMAYGSKMLPQASTVDQIKIFVSSGTFDAEISLYGISNEE